MTDFHPDVGTGDEGAEPADVGARYSRPHDPELGVIDEKFVRPGRHLRGRDHPLMIIGETDCGDRAYIDAVVVDLGLAGLKSISRAKDDRDLGPLAEVSRHRDPRADHRPMNSIIR